MTRFDTKNRHDFVIYDEVDDWPHNTETSRATRTIRRRMVWLLRRYRLKAWMRWLRGEWFTANQQVLDVAHRARIESRKM